MQLHPLASRFFVIVNVVTLKDQVNPVLITTILDGMNSFVIHLYNFPTGICFN
jgi:hypothetical protein